MFATLTNDEFLAERALVRRVQISFADDSGMSLLSSTAYVNITLRPLPEFPGVSSKTINPGIKPSMPFYSCLTICVKSSVVDRKLCCELNVDWDVLVRF